MVKEPFFHLNQKTNNKHFHSEANMIKFICAATVTTMAIFLMVLSSIINAVLLLIMASTNIIKAGPAAKAEAKKRGPNRALFQKGRACKP